MFFLPDRTYLNNLGRGCPKAHQCKIIFKSGQYFWTRRFLKFWQFSPILMPQQIKFFLELNSLDNIKRRPPKEHSCEVTLKSVHWFNRRSHLQEIINRLTDRHWCGRESASGAGGHQFNHLPGHSKDLTSGSNGFLFLALRVAGLALHLTNWCQDKWTSRTGNLPRRRRDIT